MRPRAIEAANAAGILRAELPEAAAFVWAAIEGDEDGLSDQLAREHGITALPGRHFGAPHAAPAHPVRRASRRAHLSPRRVR